jgi:hypothetical protein
MVLGGYNHVAVSNDPTAGKVAASIEGVPVASAASSMSASRAMGSSTTSLSRPVPSLSRKGQMKSSSRGVAEGSAVSRAMGFLREGVALCSAQAAGSRVTRKP